MQSFKQLIENKKVIFVGPSRILEGTQKGKWINSFDTIIRTNGAFPVKDYYEVDYGTRCDILYVNVSFSKMAKPLPVEKYKEKGMSWICFKSQHMTDAESLAYYQKHVKCRSFFPVVQKLQKEVNGILTGSCLMQDIIDHNPREFWVAGVDYYLGGSTMWRWEQAYIDNYLPDETLRQAKIKLAKNQLIPHDISSNKEFQIGLYKKGLLKYDDDILKLLGLYGG